MAHYCHHLSVCMYYCSHHLPLVVSKHLDRSLCSFMDFYIRLSLISKYSYRMTVIKLDPIPDIINGYFAENARGPDYLDQFGVLVWQLAVG